MLCRHCTHLFTPPFHTHFLHTLFTHIPTYTPPLPPPPSLTPGKWFLGTPGSTCDQTCAVTGGKCNSAKQTALTTNELVKDAFEEAGHTCTAYHGETNDAGTPFLKNGAECAPFKAGSGATSACGANTFGSHAPLCYCDDALAPLPHTLGSRTFQAGIAGLSGDMDSLDGVYWTEWFDRDDPSSGAEDNDLRSIQENSHGLVCGGTSRVIYEYEKVGVGECWDEDLGWHGSAYQMTEVNNDPETCYQGT